MASKIDPEVELIADIAGFTHDPLGHALYAYPWGSERLPSPGPRSWQRDTLTTIGEHLSDPETRFTPLRVAIASGHGIGKSALISMIAKWGLDTCEDCKVVITANTEPQLRTKTMPEIAKWSRLAITSHWFKITASALASTAAGHETAWRLDAVTWSKDNTEAFAGLHNMGKRIIVIYDEASGIDDKVWEVTLGALTDEETEIIWIAFGNPTKNTGQFRACFGKDRTLWKTRQIDSRTVEGTNKEYLQSLVDAYGEDSDIAKVRVRGMFPSASSMQFIGMDLVQEARTRETGQTLGSDPVIFGVDCARFGDDHSTLAIRCGRDARSRPWKRWHHMDSMTIAGDIALQAQMWKPDAIFVDAGNIGAAIVDRLRQLMPDMLVIEVWFGGQGREVEMQTGVRVRTANKRAEIWTSMRAWLKGGCIPDEQQLEDDLTGPEYAFNADQAIQLEKKEHMKKRGLASPDDADALAVTFAEPVMPRTVPGYLDPVSYGKGEYDRYSEV
ncbi:terminase [Sphingomonas turrisvirgatae]|uniref:Terminase n=1 Tax=Sphingomonas turrisvirgatae TaxID=1888892 RepID=A0A1E3LZM8_9SPHN|nr:terminase [Sphingomonas turrisvirgatae]ODP39266.1 terminase [Sphingomonas turrisvirgatae]